MTDEEKAVAEKAEADRIAAEQKSAAEKDAAEKAVAEIAASDKAAADKAAAEKADADRKGEQRSEDRGRKTAEDLERVTTERDTLKGQVTTVTAERDAAVKERDGYKAEVERLSKMIASPEKPPAGGGGSGKQNAEEWLKEQLAK